MPAVFDDDPRGPDDGAATERHPNVAPPSVLRALNAVQRRMAGWPEPPAVPDPHDCRALARDLLHALDLSRDVALACVLRSQVGGTYALRHSVETAAIAAMAGRHLRVRPVHLLSLTAAALALHATGRHERAPAEPRPGAAAELEWFVNHLLAHAPGHAPDETMLRAGAHLLRMADRYCAGVSPRNVWRALRPDEALARALDGVADPVLAGAFAEEIGPYPPGALVLLHDGATGVVTHRDGGRLEVLCLADGAGRPLPPPQPRRTDVTIMRTLDDDEAGLAVAPKRIWGPLASL